MHCGIAFRTLSGGLLAVGWLIAGAVAHVSADEPARFEFRAQPAQQDVLCTRAVAAQPVMLVAAPGPHFVVAPLGAMPGAALPAARVFSVAVAAAPPAEDTPPPQPAPPAEPAPPGPIFKAPILQRFVPPGAIQAVGPAGETGKFWLGIMCVPAPEVLRAQMDIPEGTGLVVHEVVPDGPAAKAGVKRNDVLLKADGKLLPDAAALGRVVNDLGAAEIAFDTLRGGKPQVIKMTPAERPQPFTVALPQGDDVQAIEQWIEQLRKLAADRAAGAPGGQVVPGRPLRLRIFRPGRVAEGHPQQPFPADLKVKVTRDGNAPWKIEVQQGEQSWQITSEELAKLPETIRPHIQAMLGNLGGNHAAGGIAIGTAEAFPIPEVEIQGSAEVEVPSVEGAPPIQGATPPAAAQAPAAKDRSGDIKELRDQLKDLQRKLDQLGKEKK